MVNHVKKYNWTEIQSFYDEGNNWRDIQARFGVSSQAIKKAKDRGDLLTRTPREAIRASYDNGTRRHYNHTQEFKDAVAQRQTLNNTGGRCKWFIIEGQRLQGTWERDAAISLSQNGISWRKMSKKADTIWYTDGTKRRAYTPDFHLESLNLIIEIKGYWWGRDKDKMTMVLQQYPHLPICIVTKKIYERLLNGQLSWCQLTPTKLSDI